LGETRFLWLKRILSNYVESSSLSSELYQDQGSLQSNVRQDLENLKLGIGNQNKMTLNDVEEAVSHKRQKS